MDSLRLNHLNLALILGAFIATLFFNGIDIRFFALAYALLFAWLLLSGIYNYRKAYLLGNLAIPVSLLLFWIWLGINIVFSQVFYLSLVNFWWVGIFVLTFFAYSFSPDNETLWKQLLPALVLLTVILACYALYQVLVLQFLPQATFLNKNSLAALLNLIFFPVLAYCLITSAPKRITISLIIIFLFALLLALINSRGALLGFFLGMFALLLLGWRQVRPHRLAMIGVVIVCAFISAKLITNQAPQIPDRDPIQQITTLKDTGSAGRSRFVIWQPAWELFKQNSWTGIGLGSYFLAIPPLLHNSDRSAGFYVHNDYLQIALETGIPGFIFLLLVQLAILYRLIISLRASPADHPQRLHFLSLFAALLTLAIHSVFTYNLYVVPIMLLAGLLLGRFDQLANQLEGRRIHAWHLSKLFNPRFYYTLVGVIFVAGSSYFISIGVAHYYQHKGYQHASKNRFEDAHLAFRNAQRFAPYLDSNYYADADLYRKSALVLSNQPDIAKRLLQEAMMLLSRAEELNPLRPQTAYIRGLVLQQYSPDKVMEIIEAYQTALDRNPRFIPARLALVNYLQERENYDLAFQYLRDGLAYSYRQISPAYLKLIEMTSSSARQRGNDELANYLSGLLAQYQQDYAAMLSDERQSKIINPF